MTNLEAIMEMVKKDYTYEQIKDLMEHAEPDKSQPEPEPEPNEPGTDQPDQAAVEPTEPPEPDYKALYEKEHAALLEAQKSNRMQNSQGQDKTEDDILKEIFLDVL